MSSGATNHSSTFPAPGALVNVNSSRMHIHCTGDGAPAVVLETGLFGLSVVWSTVQSGVARFTRVCSYDHAGIGWSGPRVGVLTPTSVVNNLHTLLRNAEVPGPYVLVGWSWGGIYTRLYAAHYPDEVAGMVLVDASHEDQFARFPPTLRRTATISGAIFHVLGVLARLRVLRLPAMQRALAQLLVPVAPDARPILNAQIARPETWETLAAQTRLNDHYVSAVRRASSLGDRPLAVVTAGATWESPNRMPPGIKPGQLTPIWHELQTELASLSSRSSHRIVPEATHAAIAVDHAEEVIDAIREVVEAVRQR